MTYHLRTDKGILVAKLDNKATSMLIGDSVGYWEEKNFVKGGPQKVYVFMEPVSWGNGIITLTVWEDFYLQKEA